MDDNERETRAERREKRKKPKMKVSGRNIKRLAQTIARNSGGKKKRT